MNWKWDRARSSVYFYWVIYVNWSHTRQRFEDLFRKTYQTMTSNTYMLYIANHEFSGPLHPCSACDTFICRFNIAAYFTYTWSLLLLQWQAALGPSIYAQTWWHLLSSWRCTWCIYMAGIALSLFNHTTRAIPLTFSSWHNFVFFHRCFSQIDCSPRGSNR